MMCVRKEEGSEFLQESAGETEPIGMLSPVRKNTASLSLSQSAELHMNVDILCFGTENQE